MDTQILNLKKSVHMLASFLISNFTNLIDYRMVRTAKIVIPSFSTYTKKINLNPTPHNKI